VRFTTEEYEHLHRQARLANVKPAALLRELSLGSCLAPVPQLPKDVFRAIRSFGGNLNQLARQANMGNGSPKQVEALRSSVDDLLKALLH
jgi:hypothetical protein